MAKKKCVTCGDTFFSSLSSKKITCSKLCSAIRKSQSHTGVKNKWNLQAKKNLSKKGQTKNLKAGTMAALESPISGPFETNMNAQQWVLKDPSGHIHKFLNLNLFLRSNIDLLDGTVEQARAGIMQIKRSDQGKTKRPVSQWKGWKLIQSSIDN